MKATEIMTRHPVRCSALDPVADAARAMVECDYGALPIVDAADRTRAVGVMTDRDIVARVVAAGRDPTLTLLSDAMSSPPVWVPHDANIEEVGALMAARKVRRILVQEGDHLCGIIALADLALRGPAAIAAAVVRAVSCPRASLRA